MYANGLYKWYQDRAPKGSSQAGFELLSSLLTYEPARRITAREALTHKWWGEEPKVSKSSFPPSTYPTRRVTRDDSDPKLTGTVPPPIGSGSRGKTAAHNSLPGRPTKRSRLD